MSLNIDIERAFFTHFHVLRDGPFFRGKTTDKSKSPYYMYLENVRDMYNEK